MADSSKSMKAPMETVTRGRIYATLDKDNDVKHITFYDSEGERTIQIDIKGKAHKGMLPHVHEGYEHSEIVELRDMNTKERKIVDSTLTQWTKKRKKLGL